MRGSIVVRRSIQGGRFWIGNMAPLKKNIGSIIKLVMRVKPCMLFILAAIAIPMAVRINEIKNMAGTSFKMVNHER